MTNAAAILIMSIWLVFISYGAITNELCQGVKSGSYDKATQEAMKLTTADCDKPWYLRL